VSVRPAGRAAAIVIGLATAVVIVAASIVPFLSPAWVAFEQGRADAAAWTGYTDAELRSATDAILSDLVLGPPAFDVTVRGEAVLNERERAHMRDVRMAFTGLWLLAAVGGVVLVATARLVARPAWWRAVGRGALGLAVAVVGLGVVALLAFDVLFEVFHRLLFAGGSYTFDPATERLVQLFPFAFWQETAIVVGGVTVLAAAVVALAARPRASRALDLETPAAPHARPIVESGS
jgi:integral membrane protein (TIGR01906 family)